MEALLKTRYLCRICEVSSHFAFDSGLKQLYVSAESGNVTVFREDGKTLVTVGSFSMPHAHTVSVDSDTHLVYFPLQNIDGHPLLRIMETSRKK
jgi:hypothetical protein